MPRLWPDPRGSHPKQAIWLWLVIGTLAIIFFATAYRHITG